MDLHRLIAKYWQGNGVLFLPLHAGERSQKQMAPTLGWEKQTREDEVKIDRDVLWFQTVGAFSTGYWSRKSVSAWGLSLLIAGFSRLEKCLMALNRIFSKCLMDVSFEMTKETILLFSVHQHREELCQATKYSVPLQQYFLLTRGNRSRCRPCFHWWSLMLESVGYRCGPCTLFWAPPLSSTTNSSSDAAADAGDGA